MERTSSDDFLLKQSAYIRKIATMFSMVEAKSSIITMGPRYPNVQQKEKESMSNGERYRSLVGALLYVAVCARPGIAIEASILGRKVSKPSEAYWVEAKRTLRYLRSPADLKLQLSGAGGLERFIDAD